MERTQELESLRNKNESLQAGMQMMEVRNDQLESMIIQIQKNIITRLTKLGDVEDVTCECGQSECTCKNQKT